MLMCMANIGKSASITFGSTFGSGMILFLNTMMCLISFTGKSHHNGVVKPSRDFRELFLVARTVNHDIGD